MNDDIEIEIETGTELTNNTLDMLSKLILPTFVAGTDVKAIQLNNVVSVFKKSIEVLRDRVDFIRLFDNGLGYDTEGVINDKVPGATYKVLNYIRDLNSYILSVEGDLNDHQQKYINEFGIWGDIYPGAKDSMVESINDMRIMLDTHDQSLIDLADILNGLTVDAIEMLKNDIDNIEHEAVFYNEFTPIIAAIVGTGWTEDITVKGNATKIAELEIDIDNFKSTGLMVNNISPVNGNIDLDPDDLNDTNTTHKFVSAAEKTKIQDALISSDNSITDIISLTKAQYLALSMEYKAGKTFITTDEIEPMFQGGSGGGDMLKGDYDQDGDGSVSWADNIKGIPDATRDNYYGTGSDLSKGFHEFPDFVKSVNTVLPDTGDVTITSDNISDTNKTNKFVTAEDLTKLSNTSNTNSGDETETTIKTKLGIATLSGVNTGDETATTIKTKLGITTLSGSNTGDQTETVFSDSSVKIVVSATQPAGIAGKTVIWINTSS